MFKIAAHVLERLDIVILHMINFIYKVIKRTPIQLQLNNFIEWKSAFSSEMIEHRKALTKFVLTMGVDDVAEIQNEQLVTYADLLRKEGSAYQAMSNMKSVRSFINYCHKRRYGCINPKLIRISEKGDIRILKENGENDIIPRMMTPKKKGRPPHVEYIEKVKLLRDSGKLNFRQIGKALDKDVSQVYEWYRYPKEKLEEAKKMLAR